MQDYQLLSIIGVNIATLVTFLGVSVAMISSINRRIDKMPKWKKGRRINKVGKKPGRPKKIKEQEV